MIEKDRWYNITELHTINAFPWLKNRTVYWRFVREQFEKGSALKVKKIKGIRKNAYMILGASVEDYLKSKIK